MKKSVKKEIIITIAIALFFVVFLSPIVIALSGSFRELKDTSSYLNIFTSFSIESYKAAFEKMNYFRSLKNSILITVTSVAILLLICSMAGYAIARLKGRMGPFFQIFFLAGMIVSAQMSIIPMYRIVNALGIGNTIIAPICLYVTSALPFSIFLYTNFIKSGVPYALEESACIDGANVPYTFFKIVIPLTKPALVSIVITQGVPIWNDFFFGMLFLSSPEKKTLPLTMMNFIGDMENATQWNMLFAACFLSAIPILIIYVFLQRYFVSGLTVGAVKG
ncbi:carbohydrate ABC transporter permease [Clostridium sp. C105KSO13]|uniref:carbohydrate ABC transporter permease n=1 Tax=Clostridium sp. C105KSO13 TaxID=1776045 RepID=UPI00074087C3|nr:carbohydrate ABC transporter permease [Clostridium sp. C105KSO13]CUX17388.1 Inner membrane ABC transporter permease protein YcjP [Clostridium sp. C105KSO13]